MAGFLEQLNQLFASPPQRRLLLIMVVVILALAGFGSLIFWNQQPEFQVLFSNLAQEDTGEMVGKLKEKKIPYQLSADGKAILVPRDQVYEIRLALAGEGLPKGGGVGFEVFDRTNLGATDFVQKLNYQRALQGELARTIRQIKEVEQARVHIVTPRESLFVEDQKRPTASVFVKTHSGMSLAPAQVEGIVHLVASSVEGLDFGNITVVDTSGKILSKRVDSSPLAQLTSSQLEYQRNIEEGLKKKVQGMLEGILGMNKAITRVATEIDFQEISIIEETYDPKAVIRSEQRGVEKSSQTSGVAAQKEVKGKAADRKGEKGKASSGSSATSSPPQPLNASQAERQNEIRNYEISKVNRQIKNPVGLVKKISVAVIVDGTFKETGGGKTPKIKQYVPRAPEEMKNLEAIIKRAIGYDEKRGDLVEVLNMPFSLSPLEEDLKPDQGSAWKEYLLMFYKPLVSLILAFMFITFVIKPLIKKGISTAPLPQPALPQPSPEQLPPGGATPQLTGGKKALEPREQTVKLVQEDPAKTAGIVKAWLQEKE
jgi:flagellar M-ring protein FliF